MSELCLHPGLNDGFEVRFEREGIGDKSVTSPSEETTHSDPAADFALPIGTGMHRVPTGAGSEFDEEMTEQLQKRLDEFDAVRTRGEVESRSVHLGGQPPR